MEKISSVLFTKSAFGHRHWLPDHFQERKLLSSFTKARQQQLPVWGKVTAAKVLTEFISFERSNKSFVICCFLCFAVSKSLYVAHTCLLRPDSTRKETQACEVKTEFYRPLKLPFSSPSLLCHPSISPPVLLLSSNTVQATCRQNWVMANLRPAAPITLPPESGPRGPWIGFKHQTLALAAICHRQQSWSAELLLTNRAVNINDEFWTHSWVNNTLFQLWASDCVVAQNADLSSVCLCGSWLCKAFALGCRRCVSDGFKEPKLTTLNCLAAGVEGCLLKKLYISTITTFSSNRVKQSCSIFCYWSNRCSGSLSQLHA